MMTGSVSTFADVALNFGAPAVRGDSVLRVANARGRRTVMYGDDTWLRLFPGLWAEFDGTTSFYVTDYTEVLSMWLIFLKLYYYNKHLWALYLMASHQS